MCLYLIAVIVPVVSVFVKNNLVIDRVRKQIPLIKVVVYLGVIVLTFMDKIFTTVNSDLALKSAVLMASVYEILSIIVEHNMMQIKKEHMKIMKKVLNSCVKLLLFLLFLGFILVIVPLLVGVVTGTNPLEKNTGSQWIDFWGGYLGAIIGGAITLYVLWKTLSVEKRIHEREEKIQYFNDMIKLFADYRNLTVKLCRSINGCVMYKKAENFNEAISINNTLSKCNSEIMMLLLTRSETYDLEELLKENSKYVEMIKEMVALHIEASKVQYKDKILREKILSIKNKIMNEKNELEVAIVKTVQNNLYSVTLE